MNSARVSLRAFDFSFAGRSLLYRIVITSREVPVEQLVATDHCRCVACNGRYLVQRQVLSLQDTIMDMAVVVGH